MDFKSILKEIQDYDYKGREYSRTEGKTLSQLEDELYTVYNNYEYSNTDTGIDFEEMVQKFADDDFYNLHFVAKKYLELTAPTNDINEDDKCPMCGDTHVDLVRNEYQYSMGDQEMPEYICKDCLNNLRQEI